MAPMSDRLEEATRRGIEALTEEAYQRGISHGRLDAAEKLEEAINVLASRKAKEEIERMRGWWEEKLSIMTDLFHRIANNPERAAGSIEAAVEDLASHEKNRP
jgi:flagellar biosynthesis/type III secretory pathway protein FliH